MKANAVRQMMPNEILDAVNLLPQHRTFVEIRDYMLQQVRQRHNSINMSQMSSNVAKFETEEQESDS